MKNKLLYIVPVLIVLIVLGVVFYEPIRQTAIADGLTILSISTTQVISKSTNLAGTFFLIDSVANGGSQSIVGTITPEETKQYSGYQTQYPLKITISAIDETVDINIQNLAKPLYRYTYFEQNSFSCPAGTEYDILVNVITQKRICINKIQDGIVGRLSDTSAKFRADITLEANNVARTKEISSDVSSVNFYDNEASKTGLRAAAQWVGSLVTGDQLPNYADIIPIYFPNIIQKWQLIRESTKDTLDNKYTQTETLLTQWKSTGWSDLTQIKSTVDNFNLYYDSVVKQEDVQIQSSSLINKENKDAGLVRFMLDRRVQSPEILFKVRADWVGVLIPTGIPKILQLSSKPFNNGEAGVIDVTILNAGDARATFAADVSNCDPFDNKYTAETNKVSIDPLKTTTLPVELRTGELNQDLTKTCTVTVYDVNDPTYKDSETVTVTMKKAVACVEGNEWIEGTCIRQCKNGENVVKECCDYGITTDDNGNYLCKEKGDTGSPPPETCKPLIDNAFLTIDNPFCTFRDRIEIISILIGIVVGLIVFGYSFPKYAVSGRKKKKVDTVMAIVTTASSLAIGIIAWLLVQSFFDFIFSFWGIVTIIISIFGLLIFNKIRKTLGL